MGWFFGKINMINWDVQLLFMMKDNMDRVWKWMESWIKCLIRGNGRVSVKNACMEHF